MKAVEQQVKEYDGLLDLLEDLDREGITGLQRQEAYRRFLNLQARMQGVPHSVGFELTPLCNFDCKMCYVRLSSEQLAKEGSVLSTAQWLKIMEQAVDAGAMYADITGGECLTHPGFKELYLYLRSRGVMVGVLTNGQLITEEMADFFSKHPPSVIQITIYGSDEDAYEKVTGRRAFADVCAAIERLKQRNIRVFLSVTPSQYMQKDTHALITFLQSTGLSFGIGTGSLPPRENTEKKMADYLPDSKLYVNLHLEERAIHATNNVDVASNELSNVTRIPKGFQLQGKLACAAGQSACHINWKGEMQPCVPFYTVRCSVLDNSFASAWKWTREQMLRFEPPQECMDCPHLTVCHSCPAERTAGILNGPVNKSICERCIRYVEAGIVNAQQESPCL